MKNDQLEKKISELLEHGLVDWESSNDRISQLKLIKNELKDFDQKDSVQQILRITKALNHPMRLLILLAIKKGVKCPCELEYITGLSQATVSHHLGLLEVAGLISRDRRGKWSILSPTDSPLLKELLLAL